ncbi:MAG: hypothetical protein K2X66_08435, partial [Cyanobacteria bacterium]|nr:hypothetical protein [Cyanobacteriota bacterium]
YLDAFIGKIVGDPSPLVRYPILMAMELGYIKQVTPPVMHILEGLAKGKGMENMEPDMVKGIISTLKNPPPLESTEAHPRDEEGNPIEQPPVVGNSVHFGQSYPLDSGQINGQSLNFISDTQQVQPMDRNSPEARVGQRLNLVSARD